MELLLSFIFFFIFFIIYKLINDAFMLRRELAREIPIQKSKYPSPKKNNFIILSVT